MPHALPSSVWVHHPLVEVSLFRLFVVEESDCDVFSLSFLSFSPFIWFCSFVVLFFLDPIMSIFIEWENSYIISVWGDHYYLCGYRSSTIYRRSFVCGFRTSSVRFLLNLFGILQQKFWGYKSFIADYPWMRDLHIACYIHLFLFIQYAVYIYWIWPFILGQTNCWDWRDFWIVLFHGFIYGIILIRVECSVLWFRFLDWIYLIPNWSSFGSVCACYVMFGHFLNGQTHR